jgi:hypothetical protein
MSKEEESDFKKYRPIITEVTVAKTAEAFGLGDEIVSLSVRSAGIDALILLLATDSEERGPYLLNAVCARELCASLIAEGFGPKK